MSVVLLCVLVLAVLGGYQHVYATYVDLTWPYVTGGIPTWKGYRNDKYQFKMTVDHAGPYLKAPWVAFNIFQTVEHMGTHIDAPYHFARHGRTVDQLPLEDLHGSLVIIDISSRAKDDRGAFVDVDDIKAWEETFGRIPERAFILMNSGWGQYWGDQDGYVGESDEDEYGKYPGFSLAATEWLLQNRPDFLGIGVDSLGCDIPPSFDVHIRLLGADKLCLENVRLYKREVPSSGAEFFVLPILIKNGTGGPSRMFAVWNEPVLTGGATRPEQIYATLVCGVYLVYMFHRLW